MSDPRPFDMPDATHSWEARGGWVIDRFAIDLNLQPFQAGGIVGNLGYESAGFSILQEQHPISGRGGWGWEQATGSRRRAMEAWAAAHNFSLSADEANYGFILFELQGAYASVVSRLRQTATIEEAVMIFGIYDEAPYGTTPTHLPGYAERLAWGKRAMIGASAPPPPIPQVDIRSLIIMLQQALNDQTAANLAVDGNFGPRSYAALQNWQRQRN